jgi:acetylornithine deacetylase/succinyl-diaminopimelate desuccinylase-like protein
MTLTTTSPRRLDRRPLRRGGALPAGAGARAHRHAAGQQRAARRAHGRTAGRLGLTPSAPGARGRGAGYGLQSITNLIVRRRYGDGGPVTIALNAHGDVVPPGEGWTHDPYGGEMVDGKLYGRAAAVSKSDFATFTFALRALEAWARRCGRGRAALHLRRGVRRRTGPRLAAEQGLTKPDLLIAAGFSYQVVTAHNGCLQMEVTLHGLATPPIPAHRRGRAAGRHAHPERAVRPQRRCYQASRSRWSGITHPYLNVGRIEGGTNTNVVPGKVVLKLDRRMIPEETRRGGSRASQPSTGRGATRPGVRWTSSACCWPSPAAAAGNAPLVAGHPAHGQAVFGEPIPAWARRCTPTCACTAPRASRRDLRRRPAHRAGKQRQARRRAPGAERPAPRHQGGGAHASTGTALSDKHPTVTRTLQIADHKPSMTT